MIAIPSSLYYFKLRCPKCKNRSVRFLYSTSIGSVKLNFRYCPFCSLDFNSEINEKEIQQLGSSNSDSALSL